MKKFISLLTLIAFVFVAHVTTAAPEKLSNDNGIEYAEKIVDIGKSSNIGYAEKFLDAESPTIIEIGEKCKVFDKKSSNKFAQFKILSYICTVKQTLITKTNNSMNTLKETLRGIKALVVAKTIKGTSFVGVREYINSKGEISNQTLLVGFDLVKLLKNDLETLKQFDIQPLCKEHDKEIVMKAYEELLNSLAKRTATEEEKEQLRKENDSTINRSDAQNNAYTYLAKGVFEHDGQLYVKGMVVAKKVLKKGEYKAVNSREKTIVKNKIQKMANLKNTKLRSFVFKNMDEVRLQGMSA